VAGVTAVGHYMNRGEREKKKHSWCFFFFLLYRSETSFPPVRPVREK